MPDKPLAIVKPEELAIDQPSPVPATYAGYPPYLGRNNEADNQLLNYWRKILARKWLVIGIFLSVFTLVTVGTFRLTPRYRAVASMVVIEQRNRLLPSGGAEQIAASGDLYNIQTQIDLLTSRNLAQKVVERMNLTDHPRILGAGSLTSREQDRTLREASLVQMILAGLKVQPRRGSRVIDVYFEGYDPVLAPDIANNICEAFIRYDLDSRVEDAARAADWLTGQVSDMKEKVEQSQMRLVEYTRQNPIITPGETGSLTVTRLEGLSQRLLQSQSARIDAQARLESAKRSQLNSLQGESPVITSLLQRLAELRQKYVELTSEYIETAPPVVAKREEIRQVESQLEAARSATRDNMLERLETEYQTSLQQEKEIQALVDRERSTALEETNGLIQYQILKQEAEATQKIYNDLLQRLKEATLVAGMSDPSVRIVDLAPQPAIQSYPPVTRNLLFGGVLGLGLGLGFVFLLDYLDNTLKTAEDINRVLQLPALGVIPALGTLNKRRLLGNGADLSSGELIVQHPAESAYAEAYRSLRTSVLLSSADRAPKTILVTSAQPSEGKTTTAVNIAISLGQTGAKVLVIDADMRRPRCHKALMVGNKRGLSTYLSTDTQPEELIVTTAAGIDLLPCGPIPPNPSELLTSSRLTGALRDFERQYDHVVIDSPPIATVSDALILSTSVDGVVLVVHGGETNQNISLRARKMLQDVGAKIFGVVLNKVDAGSSYYYDYYYKYGYYYSRELVSGEEKSLS